MSRIATKGKAVNKDKSALILSARNMTNGERRRYEQK